MKKEMKNKNKKPVKAGSFKSSCTLSATPVTEKFTFLQSIGLTWTGWTGLAQKANKGKWNGRPPCR